MTRRYRLAAVTDHPVQYQAPLFQKLAADDSIDLSVYYGDDRGDVSYVDPGFARPIRWDRPLRDGYRSTVLKPSAKRLNAIGRITADARIFRAIWRGRYDAVFIHSYATRLSLFTYVAALASRTPVLLRTESHRLQTGTRWLDALRWCLLKPLLAVTRGVLVIGKANRQFFEHYGVSASRQFNTPYAVDNDYFVAQRRLAEASRTTSRDVHGWTDDVVVIGYAGKLVPRKRVQDLVDAVAMLQDEGLKAGLLIVGDGPDRASLERRVNARGMKWTVFDGFKNQSELSASYGSMDIFALPSESETWGLVLNEAMVFGMPVLATTVVGAGLDLIEPEKNGYLFDVGDVAALADGLRRLVTSPDLRRQFGQRSESIVRRYSIGACVEGVLAGLREATRDHRVPSPAADAPEL